LADEDDEGGVDAEEGGAASAPALGNQTMQVDALLEEIDDGVAVPDDALAQILADSGGGAAGLSAPPPLPPKSVGKGTIIAGVLIVLLAAGGGIFFGMSFLGEPAPVVQEAPAAEAAEPAAEELGDEDEEAVELEAVPITLDEVAIPHPDDEMLDDEPEAGEE